MNLTEHLFLTMKEKKITQDKLAKALNITQSTIATWKQRGTMPPTEFIPKICEILGVSYEYILTGQENKAAYTREENDLIKKYRKANDTGRKKIMEYAEEMKNVYPAEVQKEMIS